MNSRTIKKALLFFAALLLQFKTSAQTVQDVDSLGDIWVVTIDETFSMMREKVKTGKNTWTFVDRDMRVVSDSVASRLRRSSALNNIDWRHDRFIFMKSGFSSINDIKRAANLDTSFIVFENGKFETFSDRNELTTHVSKLMQKMNYKKNYQSFVSQMRSLSLKKAIDYLWSNNECRNYRNINILTISDDAVDQNDQWSTDYRTLKEHDSLKVKWTVAPE